METLSRWTVAAPGFDPAPSFTHPVVVTAEESPPENVAVIGVPVASNGFVPTLLGLDRAALLLAGFEAKVGQTLAVPQADKPLLIAVGVGDTSKLDANCWRDAAGHFALATSSHKNLALYFPSTELAPEVASQNAIEGVFLARYTFSGLKGERAMPPLESLALIVEGENIEQTKQGIARGTLFADAARLSRDLAGTPPAHLTAARFAEVAKQIAAKSNLEIEVFGKEELIDLGCGGLLGVNAGSTEEPRMIKLTYKPATSTSSSSAHLSLVGKGIMYDSGGISLKPGDSVHATMKNDMTGAGAILSMMSVLSALKCPTAVTGYLMCTDNMPSGSALKLGDVLTTRGGTTVEVINTDAEGRLVMADALVLATETNTDAIVDIATLTGACLRALGTRLAGVLGTNQNLIDQLISAGSITDETLWQLPLERAYRKELDSDIADIKNIGGVNAGSITAALFLAEFIGDVPFAHVDIAGTAQGDVADSWRPKGVTGFGARMLLEFVLDFKPPTNS